VTYRVEFCKDLVEGTEFTTGRHEVLIKREVIKQEIKPLQDGINNLDQKVEDVQKDVKKLRASMITVDRIVMKMALDGYEKQGYTSSSDRAAWRELYDNYEDLGGNHFKEYVGEWKKRLEALPKKEDIIVILSLV